MQNFALPTDPLSLAQVAVAVLILLLGYAFPIWSAALQRREAHTPGSIVFAHPTGPLRFAATIIAGAWLIPALFPTFLPALIPWLFPLANPHLAIITSAFSVAFLGFVPQVLRFDVAAGNGLTTRLLIFKKTLPWRAIDWVYLHQKTTRRRRFGGGLVQDSALYLIAEAGKKRKIRLLLKRNSSIGGDYSALFAAIQWYAPHAQIGSDKRFVVTAMRARNFDLATREQTFQSPPDEQHLLLAKP